jgi:hypothetical protein
VLVVSDIGNLQYHHSAVIDHQDHEEMGVPGDRLFYRSGTSQGEGVDILVKGFRENLDLDPQPQECDTKETTWKIWNDVDLLHVENKGGDSMRLREASDVFAVSYGKHV